MKRKRILFAAICSTMLLCFALVLGLVLTRESISRTRFDRIKPGMTIEEVTGLLGPPSEFVEVRHADIANELAWKGRTTEIRIGFDRNGDVVDGWFRDGTGSVERFPPNLTRRRRGKHGIRPFPCKPRGVPEIQPVGPA